MKFSLFAVTVWVGTNAWLLSYVERDGRWLCAATILLAQTAWVYRQALKFARSQGESMRVVETRSLRQFEGQPPDNGPGPRLTWHSRCRVLPVLIPSLLSFGLMVILIIFFSDDFAWLIMLPVLGILYLLFARDSWSLRDGKVCHGDKVLTEVAQVLAVLRCGYQIQLLTRAGQLLVCYECPAVGEFGDGGATERQAKIIAQALNRPLLSAYSYYRVRQGQVDCYLHSPGSVQLATLGAGLIVVPGVALVNVFAVFFLVFTAADKLSVGP